jgi:hypothetical protein
MHDSIGVNKQVAKEPDSRNCIVAIEYLEGFPCAPMLSDLKTTQLLKPETIKLC